MDKNQLEQLIDDQLTTIIAQANALRENKTRPDMRPPAAALLASNCATLAEWEKQLREIRREA